MNRIHLISGPRNISTALMYSFGNRGDCTIIDEPYYAFYLKTHNVEHPGKKEIINSMSVNSEEITKQIILRPYSTPVVFIKNMAHHIDGMDESFLSNVTNIFLIRNPKKVIHSFSKIISNPDINDIGIRKQWELFKKIKNKRSDSIVLDSDFLLKDPESVLRKMCIMLKINFKSSMLKWKPGPRLEDGIWSKYWYESTHKSSGFESQNIKEVTLPSRLNDLYIEANSYYQKLLKLAINP